MKKVLLLILIIPLFVFAQTGPASIGNSDGSDGEPHNVIWFDASTLGLSNNAHVTNWIDNSGNNNDGTQGTSASQPTFKTSQIGGKSAVVFDGSDDFIPFNGNLIAGKDYTVILVTQRRTSGSRRLIMGGTNNGANKNLHIFWQNNSNFRSHHWSNDLSTAMNSGAGKNANEYGIFSTRLRSGDASAQRKNYQNNNELGSINNANTLISWDGAALARFRGPAYYDVDIAEVIIYATALNDAQLDIVHNYLNVKYGITIANDRYSEASGYTYNVTGIGNKNNEEQNSSVSAGFYVEDQGNTLDDGEFVFFSHNNATNDETNIQTGTNVTNSGAEAAWNRNWYLQKTGGNVDANISFDFSEAFTSAKYPQDISNYVILYKANIGDDYTDLGISPSLVGADRLKFFVPNANLVDGFYTLGTKDQTNSPVQGAAGQAWYTLISGDWDNPDVWTLDPSGFLPNNPNSYTPTTSPSNTSDKVIILSGKTVTVNTNNKQNLSLEVQGEIDFKSTTGHSFTKIIGGGRILLSADNFPSGDASHFYTAGEGEGTVRYYGGSYTLNKALHFYNLEIMLNASTNKLTLLKDYTINGDFLVSTGIFQINDNSATTILNITAKNDVTVNANGKITVGTGNTIGSYSIPSSLPSSGNFHKIFHQFKIGGNLINNGTIRLTNQADPIYNQFTSTGAATVIFDKANNATALLNGITDFYNLIVDKGTDQTYILTINATNINNFMLYGANNVGRNQSSPYSAANPEIRKALWVYNGTLKLTGYVNIPTLSEGKSTTSGNGDYLIGANACLWIAGANTKVYTTATDNSTSGNTQVNDGSGASVATSGSHSAMSLLGKFRITDGVFGTRNSYGFVFWTSANAVIQIEGGEVDVSQMYSTSGGTAKTSYIQTGGLLRVRGNETEPGSLTGPLFNIVGSDASFNMSGGEILLRDYDADSDPEFNIECVDGNYSVTGGKITIDVRENSAGGSHPSNFQIYSTSNFWDLEIKNHNNSGNITVELLTDLNVSHDLTINNYCTLETTNPDDATIKDVTIGRNFSINEGAIYNYNTNTTTFNGTEDGEFYIGHNVYDGYVQKLNNFTLDKPADKSLTLKGDEKKTATWISANHGGLSTTNLNKTRLLQIEGVFLIESGILNQGEHSIKIFNNITVKKHGQCGVYIPETTSRGATIMLKDVDFTINTEEGAIFGNIKLGANGHTISLSSNVYMKRIAYFHGILNLKTYNLKLDYLHKEYTESIAESDFGSVTKMFYTSGNSSDGGLSLLVKENDDFVFPLGTDANSDTRYTPAIMTITGTLSDSGYVTINPVDEVLQTTDLTCGGDILSYYWKVGLENLGTNVQVKYKYEYNTNDLDGSTNEADFYPGKVKDGGGYLRSYENDLTKVDETNNTITFNGTGSGFDIEEANYTAGQSCRFVGSPTVYHSHPNVRRKWNNTNCWQEGVVPTNGSVVIITSNSIVDVDGTQPSSATPAETKLTDNKSRVQFYRNNGSGGSYNLGNVKGMGMISFNMQYDPVVNGDFGDFADNENSIYLFFTTSDGSSYTMDHIPQPAPTINFESGRYTLDQADLVVNYDLVSGYHNYDITIADDVLVKRNLRITNQNRGEFHFPNSGSPVTLTVNGNVTVGDPLIVDNSTNDIEHKFIVKGNITVSDGNISLFNGANRPRVILELTGDNNGSYTNTAGTIAQLYRIEMNKGTSQADTFVFNNNFTLNGTTLGVGVKKALEMKNGTLILDNSSISINLNTGDDNFNIPTTTCLEIKQGTAHVGGDDTGIKLYGKLKISGGTLDMNDVSNNGNNYIEYAGSGDSKLEITDGSLIVGSQIRRSMDSETGILKYKQTGGTVIVGKNNNPEGNRAVFEILNTGSSFDFTGGSLYLANTQTNPSVASLYLDAESSNISNAATIYLGNTNTKTNQNFGIYSTVTIPKLVIDNTSSNNPTATTWIIPLTIDNELEIQSNTEFDANGLDLILNGNLTCNGTFTHNKNSTYFRGSANQTIVGSPVFYNLTKESNANTLTLNADITIENEFKLLTGTLDDNANTVFISGDITNNGTHIWGGTSEGIKLNGTVNDQILRATGEFGKLTIDNAKGIIVPNDNSYEITINNELKMMNGVFNIDKNLLILKVNCLINEANAFGDNNMIQTNASFTDAGVKKYFPAISSATTFNFPIGSEGKYTPLIMNISNMDANGNIRVKAANERQSTITDDNDECCEFNDLENVLQYHYIVEATNVNHFTADITMQYKDADALHNNTCVRDDGGYYDESNYIAARLLTYGDNTWIKPLDYNTVDEVNNKILYSLSNVSSNDISGEYTAGIEQKSGCNGAIPQKVPEFLSAANGDWKTATNWYKLNADGTRIEPAGTGVPSGGPYGSIVYIEHEITTTTNYKQVYKTEIRAGGKLKINNTFGHRLGRVSGTGILYSERASLPAGIYEDFFATTGGTVEYGGSSDYTILPGIIEVNNLTFSGTGKREFPNNNIKLNGDLTISGPNIIQQNNKIIAIYGDITKTGGVFDFASYNNTVEIKGSANQSISGDFTSGVNAFRNLKINKSSGTFTTSSDVAIENSLILTNGIINSSSTAMIELGTAATISGGSNTAYINGEIYKDLYAGSAILFPVGNSGKYRPIGIENSNKRTQFVGEYLGANSNSNYDSPLTDVSPNNLWYLDDVNNQHPEANIVLYWGPETGVVTVSEIRVASLTDIASDNWGNKGKYSATGTTVSGHVKSNVKTSFSKKYFTIGTEGSSSLPIELLSFDAVSQNNEVKITWQTSVEINNDHFIVERSEDGVVFEEIANVMGAGNSNVVLDYLIYDFNPIKGISYYRLKQVDFDRSEIIYPMVSVNINTDNLDIEAKINVYPSPFSNRDNLTVDLIGFDYNENVQLTVTDAMGRIVFKENCFADNTILANKLYNLFANIETGYYLIMIKSNTKDASTRLIKTH